MLDFLGVLVGLCLPAAVVYYFMFGGKEKLAKHLFDKMSLAERVEKIIQTDLSPKYARAAFYIGNNYHHRMSQADWQEYCKERIDPSMDKNSPEYAEAVAPIVNAIVLDQEGFYLRRGMEDLSHNLQRFLPGVNDRISLNYFVEPYKYYENKELAEKSRKEEALRREKYEQERPMREAREAERKAAWQERQQRNRELEAAYARCRGCANSMKCKDSAKRVPGACGGYTPN